MRLSAIAALALGVILAAPIAADARRREPEHTITFIIAHIRPLGPFGPVRRRRSRGSLRRASFRAWRLIRPAKAIRMGSVEVPMIATKGASAATPADCPVDRVGPAVRAPWWRRFVKPASRGPKLQTRRRILTGYRSSFLHSGAVFRACGQRPHIFRVYLPDTNRLAAFRPVAHGRRGQSARFRRGSFRRAQLGQTGRSVRHWNNGSAFVQYWSEQRPSLHNRRRPQSPSILGGVDHACHFEKVYAGFSPPCFSVALW